MHTVLAHFAGPHWLMNEDDARNYAIAVNNVARHYDVAIAQKTIDICNLIGLVGFYEGTRLLYSRSPASRQQQPARGQVVPFMEFRTPPAAPSPSPPNPTTGEAFGPPLPPEALH